MNLITCTPHGTAAAGRAARVRIDCLKPVECDRCVKYVSDNNVDTSRFVRLYEVAKRARFGQFEADFTQFGASEEENVMVRQLFRQGLNFHLLELFLTIPSGLTAPSIKEHFDDTRNRVDP